MVRHPWLWIVLSATLGVSGCLLFTDPINEAPVVKIATHSEPVVRGVRTDFAVAKVSDDHDSPGALKVSWAEWAPGKDGSCSSIKASMWSPQSMANAEPSDLPYPFVAKNLDVVCLCVLVVDSSRATGHDCVRIAPVNPTPAIVDESEPVPIPSGSTRPLCSPVHLSGEGAAYAASSALTFDWHLDYAGESAGAAKSAQFGPCSDVPAAKADQHRCFTAKAPGTYTVTLSVTETPPAGAVMATESPSPGSYVVVAAQDRPPCILQTEPKVDAERILISRSSDLGSTYESRDFTVLSLDDDCEPLASGSTAASRFLWSIFDSAHQSWAYQTNRSQTFTINQAMFPNARPGDTIQVRVEARDSVVDKNGTGATCDPSVLLCCGASACRPTDGCIRWATWTVQFQP